MDFSFMARFVPLFAQAAWLTLRLGAAGILISFVIGIACALFIYLKIPVLKQLSRVYVEISRNTPLLIQLFFIYYGLPRIGLSLSPETCGIAGIAFLGGSYMCESIRSGLNTVKPIQIESAASLGMRRWQIMRYVVLPQAFAVSIPALTANVVFLLKETSVFSAISLLDLMFAAKDLIGLYYKTNETLFMLSVSYLLILLPVSLIGSWVERRVRHAEFGS